MNLDDVRSQNTSELTTLFGTDNINEASSSLSYVLLRILL